MTDRSTTPESVRLAELLAVLALGADLGMGQPMEHAMRQSVLALRIGELLGLNEDDRAVLYYVSLIAWVGCHIDAYEQAKWFGDDLALKGNFRLVDPVGIRSLGQMIGQIGAGRHGLDRAAVAARFFTGGMRDAAVMLHNHWYAADQLAGELGLPQDVRDALLHTFERWDGKGAPNGIKGEELQITARIVNLADVLVVFHGAGGADAAVEVARQRSGTQFDPSLVELVAREAPLLFADLTDTTTWDAIIDAEPALGPSLSSQQLDAALEAIGDFTDLKSPYTLGHTRAVAELATATATTMSWPGAEVAHVRRAALLHDLGRLGVSNAIWDKPGELTAAEAERVRLHPYLTERMLASSPALAALGATAAQHHERLDGSGYPRGIRGDSMTAVGRLLAAVDAYAGKLEPRPHRAPLSATEAAQYLRDEVRAGRQDPQSVDAVLTAAGHPTRRRREWPAGLTTREVEVLRLLARGLSNKQVAERLVISRKTVDNHVEHIYTKIGVSNRARASLFAVRHGLMAPVEDEEFTP
ncbi:MAG: HD domain-containing protein [Actinobacteria bacterium]|nr:MAG: HD domain-containing protein [Actinomycetota bacterium]